MPEDSHPPVAIRITRPYATEDEFLAQELETLSRTSVTLLGAQPRPQGVVLRFELVLSSGSVLMRGEGRVVGFRPNAHLGLGGLTLRFTRLDSRSKALVDRAAAVRERRRPGSMIPPSGASLIPPWSASSLAPPSSASLAPPSSASLAPPSSASLAPPSSASLTPPAPPASEPVEVSPFPSGVRASERPLPPEALPPEARPIETPAVLRSERSPLSLGRVAEAPTGREEVLARLRTRGQALEASAIQRILDQRKRQA